MLAIINVPNAREGLEFVQARRSDIDRACNLTQILPPALVYKSDAVKTYYHHFTEAFIRLHTAATVIDSNLVTLNSRAANPQSNVRTVLSYVPDTMKAAASALPLPAAAVMTVLSSIWIHQRDTQITNSLYAFSQLLRQQDGSATLVAKDVALSVCLQR